MGLKVKPRYSFNDCNTPEVRIQGRKEADRKAEQQERELFIRTLDRIAIGKKEEERQKLSDQKQKKSKNERKRKQKDRLYRRCIAKLKEEKREKLEKRKAKELLRMSA
jgi:hypothetical protein